MVKRKDSRQSKNIFLSEKLVPIREKIKPHKVLKPVGFGLTRFLPEFIPHLLRGRNFGLFHFLKIDILHIIFSIAVF